MQMLLKQAFGKPVHGICFAPHSTCHCHCMLMQLPAAEVLLQHSRNVCLSPQLSTKLADKRPACMQQPAVLWSTTHTMHLCVLQELFLHSPCPTAALQMRKDLQHWPQALFLANQLDPTQIPPLACNYAQVSSVCLYTDRHVCLQHRSASTAWVSSWQLAR